MVRKIWILYNRRFSLTCTTALRQHHCWGWTSHADNLSEVPCTSHQSPRKYQATTVQKRGTPWAVHLAECDEIWPLCEKDIRCKIPEERKAETEEFNPQPYNKSRPLNPHRCWIETLTRNSSYEFRHDDFWDCERFTALYWKIFFIGFMNFLRASFQFWEILDV